MIGMFDTTPCCRFVKRRSRMLAATMLVFFLMIACSASHSLPDPTKKPAGEVKIYVTKRGWHTGLLVPKTNIKASMPAVVEDFPDASHLNFSWGDKKFFMAPEGTVFLALRAALLPTRSVMHVDGLDRLPPWYTESPDVVAVELSRQGFDSMTAFIKESFEREQDSALVVLRENAGGMSSFYLSGITYWGTRTCNVWTARALKKAGLDLQPVFMLTAGQVMDKAKAKAKIR